MSEVESLMPCPGRHSGLTAPGGSEMKDRSIVYGPGCCVVVVGLSRGPKKIPAWTNLGATLFKSSSANPRTGSPPGPLGEGWGLYSPILLCD